MLLELRVSRFAIIDNLHIEFSNGLNILSGETGAGKSVLLKSLALLMGDKASSDSIRTGSDQATVEGCFDLKKRKDILARLSDMGIETAENHLIVKRVIRNDNKSRVYLNGSLSTLNDLKEIVAPLIEVAGRSAPLIEMTGQHDNRHLLSKSYHLDLLDQYAGVWDLRRAYENDYEAWLALKKEISTLEQVNLTSSQRLDFLKFQQSEIAAAQLTADEEIGIENEVKRLKNLTKIVQFVEGLEMSLYSDDDSVTTRIQQALSKRNEMAAVDAELYEKLSALEQVKSLLDDVTYDLRIFMKQLEADPERLEELQSRLSLIRKLQKKYSPTSSEILSHLASINEEIHNLENRDSILEELKTQEKILKEKILKQAEAMHRKRGKGSEVLKDSVNVELLDLNMKGVTFHISVEKAPDLSSTGITEVEFLSQTSVKDAKRPLAKFASGGELSRILLSLKRVVGSSEQPRTYLFDEVDTGVSGPTAEKVGKKLKSIAQGQQVICVTHLPQVAAYGDSHYSIQKSPSESAVIMEVSLLNKTSRVKEIARLISGEKVSKTSLAHAEQLMKEAHGPN